MTRLGRSGVAVTRELEKHEYVIERIRRRNEHQVQKENISWKALGLAIVIITTVSFYESDL